MKGKIKKFIAYSTLRTLLFAGAGFTIGNIISYNKEGKSAYADLNLYEIEETTLSSSNDWESKRTYYMDENDENFINQIVLKIIIYEKNDEIENVYIKEDYTDEEKTEMVYLYKNKQINYLIDHYYDIPSYFNIKKLDSSNMEKSEKSTLVISDINYDNYTTTKIYPFDVTKDNKYDKITDILMAFGIGIGTGINGAMFLLENQEQKKKIKRIK